MPARAAGRAGEHYIDRDSLTPDIEVGPRTVLLWRAWDRETFWPLPLTPKAAASSEEEGVRRDQLLDGAGKPHDQPARDPPERRVVSFEYPGSGLTQLRVEADADRAGGGPCAMKWDLDPVRAARSVFRERSGCGFLGKRRCVGRATGPGPACRR